MNYRKWIEKNCKSLEGKTVAVTGTTGGLGKELCTYIAQLGASLILLDRNEVRSKAHEESLKHSFPTLNVKRIPLDLERAESVKIATEQLRNEQVDIFIHNAGAYSIPRRKNECGYDNVFQINFASPYYMIKELLPSLRERSGRVMVVGSIAHNYSNIDEGDIDFSGYKAASKVYGNAKRYLMFSLFELFKNENTVTLSVTHPGITFTNITAHYPKVIFAIIKYPMKIIFMSPKKAALSLLLGLFKKPEYCEWIGPRLFNVWGYPSVKLLKTCKKEEREKIAELAEGVYARLKGI